MLAITHRIAVPDAEIQLSYMRASGPGGQNVNKVASACELRFDVATSPSLPEDVKERLVKIAGRKLTKDGVLVISSDRFRSQDMNRQDAIERLVEMLKLAARPPPPKRRPTKPTKGAVERRLQAKSTRGGVKKLRGDKPGLD
ncbi:MAG: alternative ribosome rescue aminoacyl-tRNA hydrolase ArfB [Beijerinckiaceae bacterium]